MDFNLINRIAACQEDRLLNIGSYKTMSCGIGVRLVN